MLYYFIPIIKYHASIKYFLYHTSFTYPTYQIFISNQVLCQISSTCQMGYGLKDMKQKEYSLNLIVIHDVEILLKSP